MHVLRKSQKKSKRTPRTSQRQPTSKLVAPVYEFGSFRLDQVERVLSCDGANLSLRPKIFEILVVLVENSGRLVTKETLLDQVWSDAFVEEANLSVNIASLRKVLGDAPGEHRYIETISKRGYRFVAKVTEVKDESDVMAAASGLLTPRSAQQAPGTSWSESYRSLAVLPFDNATANPNAEYLSDGLTESIINRFSHLHNLRVVGRNTVFRYKAQGEKDPKTIGRELGVGAVLTGRILQVDDRLIIRAELVDVTNGYQIWGEQYHRHLSDVLELQHEISETICTRLRARLTREEKEQLGKRYTENTDAYRLYLKGRYYWNQYAQAGLKKALTYFQEAIDIDPTYALAYAGLADTYYRLSCVYAPTRDAMPKARAAAMKALDIDETLSEAHASLGLIKMFYEWDWPGAKEEFERAIELNPNNALAHQRFGLYFDLLGRADEAIRESKAALKIDPLSLQISQSLALAFFLARDYQSALDEIQKPIEMDSNYHPAVYLLGRIYEQDDQIGKAIAAFKRVVALNDAPMFLAALGHAYALAGKHGNARKVLKELQRKSKTGYVSEYNNAAIYLALGDKNQAFQCLEAALENHCEMMSWLKVDPVFDSVRTDLRFTELLRRVGFDREYA
jgi:TolB-like protein/Tfp pilus assembly protein PilF